MENLESVWFLTSEIEVNPNRIVEIQDKGTLSLLDEEMVFKGKKYNVTITNIQDISFGVRGQKIKKFWIRVDFLTNSNPETIYLFDGRFLGWSGLLGGSKKILKKIERKYINR
jgi:hypothetical protein